MNRILTKAEADRHWEKIWDWAGKAAYKRWVEKKRANRLAYYQRLREAENGKA